MQDDPDKGKPRGKDRPAAKDRRPEPRPIEIRADKPERVAKVIARAGLCSRRDAEKLIEEGRVSVNGRVLKSAAINVGPSDLVSVDGAALPGRERTRLWLYHKPKGLVTTARDPEGRPTVFEALPSSLPRVVSVGRLDINTEGLLLLTNDGGLARVLAHPDTAWLRRYRVRVFGDPDQAELDRLRDGVAIDGVQYGPIVATLDREQGANSWLTMDLREGKNREIKRVLEHLGYQVARLIRVSFGPFQLGDLPEGAVAEVKTRVLADQLGPELAEKAGADFGSAVERFAAGESSSRVRVEPWSRENETERRIEVSDTQDRRGRPVRVERIVAEKPSDSMRRPPRRDHPADRRRPEKDRRGAPGGDAMLRRRPSGEERPRPDQRGPRGEEKPFRSREDRPPRGEDARRPPPRSREEGFKPRAGRPSRTREEGAPRRPAADRDRPRFDRDRPQGEEKPFRSREDRPPRREDARRPPPRSREEGFKPRAERPSRTREEGAPRRPPADRDRPRFDRDRPQGERKPFRTREDRPPRREDARRPPPRSREEGFKPRGERPFRTREDGAPRRPPADRDRPRFDRDGPRGEGRPFRAREDRPQHSREDRYKSPGEGKPFRPRQGRPRGRDEAARDSRPPRSRDERPPGPRADFGKPRGKPPFGKGGPRGKPPPGKGKPGGRPPGGAPPRKPRGDR